MARAKLQSDADGAVEVVVTSWASEQIVHTIPWLTMNDIVSEATEDGASEPLYGYVADTVNEILQETFLIKWDHPSADDLRKAIVQLVEPGPGFTDPIEFTI